MSPRRIGLVVLIAAGGICALIFLPVLETTWLGTAISGGFSRLVFSRVCHQDPGRSLMLGGTVLPVCARCTGIYLGFFLGWTGWFFLAGARGRRPISNLALAAGLGPMVVDGFANLAGLISSGPAVRFGTGFLFGAVAARALWPALIEAGWAVQDMIRGLPSGSTREREWGAGWPAESRAGEGEK